MLAQPRQQQGAWRVSRWSLEPSVLVLEFPDLQTQGLALNRAAALLEKGAASRDRVQGDAELAALIQRGGDNTATYFFGHDYPATALARFYNLAADQHVQLNAEERRLLALLIDAGWMRQGPDGRYAGLDPAALISFSALQADDPTTKPDETVDALRRASVLRHELSHGRFFTDARYREHCQFFWTQLMNEPEREAWRHYLASQGYDAGNEELMVNETQALLMNTPDERDFKAADLRWTPADLAALRERFQLGLETVPATRPR